MSERFFPHWPDDECSPDRFLLRPVRFSRPTPAPTGELVRTAIYANPFAREYGTQEFELTASAPAHARKQLDLYCDLLRVWFEAVPATEPLTKALADVGDVPEEGELPADAIRLDMGDLRDRPSKPIVVFSLIDPQLDSVGSGQTHNYSRPSNGTAYIDVLSGYVRLDGTSGAPHYAVGGQRTPQTAAGRYCSVYGYQRSNYWIPSVWQG